MSLKIKNRPKCTEILEDKEGILKSSILSREEFVREFSKDIEEFKTILEPEHDTNGIYVYSIIKSKLISMNLIKAFV